MYKKFTLLFLSMISSSLIFAQIKYGLKAGLAESFIYSSAEGNADFKEGFQAGVFAEVPLRGNLGIRPSLQFTEKGYRKFEGNSVGDQVYVKRNFSFNYLELPVDVVYNFKLGKNAKILMGAGPVFSYAISGRAKTNIRYKDEFEQAHTEYWDNSNRPGKLLDLGFDFLIGFTFKRINVTSSYNHGLLNFSRDGGNETKNRSFAFTLGYILNK